MKIKTITKAIAGLALAVGVAGSADAFTITVGNYKITLNSYDSGTLYGPLTPASAPFYGDLGTTGNCGTATPDGGLACDPHGNIGFGGAAFGAAGRDDSWGIISVQSITNISTSATEFTIGTDGYLIGYFGGLIDFAVGMNTPFLGDTTQTAYSQGGYLNIYKSAVDYNPAVGPFAGQAAVEAGIIAAAGGASSLYLGGVFTPGAVPSVPLASYQSTFDINTGHGSGVGYVSFDAGSALGVFDTNTQHTYPLSGTIYADAFFTTTVSPISTCSTTSPDLGCGAGWLASNTADVTGYATPEPGSMALVGLGLLGLAGLRRRKQKA